MAVVRCPGCGEEDELTGAPDGEAVRVACGACALVWHRRPGRACALCGSEQLKHRPEPVWEKARGDQRTPAGWLDAWDCYACGGRDVTSGHPRPGDPAEIRERASLRDEWRRLR